MAIKFDEENKSWTVSFSKRHPITRVPVTLRRKEIKSKAEADRVYRTLVVEVENRLHAQITPTWSEVIEKYVEDSRYRGLSEKTINSLKVCIEAHTQEKWGNRLVDSITRNEVIDLHKATVSDKSQGHQKYMLRCFRAVFNFAIEQGYLQKSPVPMMKFKDGQKIMPVLNEEQVKKLLYCARQYESEWYPHWVMALYTGMRNGELYALTWENVNLDERKIYVKEGWDSVNGFKNHTKSYHDRVVSISPELLTVLKELKLKSKGDLFVLPRLIAWDRGSQAIELRSFLTGIGLPRIRFHDLRASWATLLLSKGVEAIKVMQMGGWHDYKTMMLYIRKAGIDIQGGTDVLKLHDPSEKRGEVLEMPSVVSRS